MGWGFGGSKTSGEVCQVDMLVRLCLSLEQGKRREVSVVVNRVVGRISRFVWVKECPEGFM